MNDQITASLETIPHELKDRVQWVVWRYEVRGEKRTKVPFQSLRPKAKAKTDTPSTWSTFVEAVAAVAKASNRLDGIGFVFSRDDPYTGVDLDNCLKGGEVLDWAAPFLDEIMPTYAEISPSGNGIKFIAHATLSGGEGTRKNGFGDDKMGCVELYDRTRFFTITGNAFDVEHLAIEDRSEAIARIYAQVKPSKKKTAETPRESPTTPLDLTDSELVEKARKARNGAKFAALYDRGDTSGYAGDDSSADFAMCRLIAWWTGPDPARIERIFRSSALYRDKWEDRRGDSTYGMVTITNALDGMTEFYAPKPKRARKDSKPPDPPERPPIEGAAEVPDPNRKRPEIEINTEWHEVLERSIEALSADQNLYARGDSLVKVIQQAEDEIRVSARTTIKQVMGSPKIIAISDSNVGCTLTSVAEFFKWKEKDGEWVAVDTGPPDWLIKAVSTRKYWPGIRNLQSVVECPFPRPDGSIVEVAGYDRETRSLYLPSIEFPPVPDRPTRNDARAAWGRIRPLVDDFPFASEDDRVVYLAGLLTIIARPSILGPVPGIAVIGNKASTGKGLLVDAMVIPGTGRPCPTSTYPDSNEEATKVKVAIAKAAKVAVHFDNLEKGAVYGCGPLDSALTSTVIDDRQLGRNDAPPLPLLSAWFLSGNNVVPGKDAYRRWLVANLETEHDHPERRTDIKIPKLRKYILEHRGEIVRDALTILKAHAMAGHPEPRWDGFGSFEEWSLIVRGAVWFATDRDCLVTQRATADGSDERLEQMALLEGWRQIPGGKAGSGGVTGAEVLAAVNDNPKFYPTLLVALMARGKGGKLPTSTGLGAILRGLKNTPVGPYTLKESGKRDGAVCWVVACKDGTPTTEDAEDTEDDTGPRTRDFNNDYDVTMFGKNGESRQVVPASSSVSSASSVEDVCSTASGWSRRYRDRFEAVAMQLLADGYSEPANEIEAFAKVRAEMDADPMVVKATDQSPFAGRAL